MSILYRGRIAPTPTGYMHLGHARTFWIAQQRRIAGSVQVIVEGLKHPQRRIRGVVFGLLSRIRKAIGNHSLIEMRQKSRDDIPRLVQSSPALVSGLATHAVSL